MRCERVRKLIPLAVGNDLDAGRKRWVDHHVKGCLACYREMREWAATLSRLDPVRAPVHAPSPEGLLESIIVEVGAATPGPLAPHPTSFWMRTSRGARYAVAFAAGFALMATAGFQFFGDDLSASRGVPGGATPRVQPVTYSADDFSGEHRFVLPQGSPSKLRLVGPAPFERTEPLPAARIVPVSQRNDF